MMHLSTQVQIEDSPKRSKYSQIIQNPELIGK